MAATGWRTPAERGVGFGLNRRSHVHPSDLHGAGRLAIDAIAELTGLVESLHHAITRAPAGQTRPRTRGISGLVYRSIRAVTDLVGRALDSLLSRLVPLLEAGASSPGREAVLAAMNGVLGDHLAASGNPLAINMRLRRDGQPLELDKKQLAKAIPQATGKLLLLVHGLCMNDLQWLGGAGGQAQEDLPALLERELAYTPVYLHYNSGLHISSNGRELAALIEALVAAWPQPLSEFVIVAHSMGGLLARSACHYAARSDHAWLRRLDRLVFLGVPHHGAPLERGGNWLQLVLGASAYTAPFARLGKMRSAGITDLRYGNLIDEDWAGSDRFAHAGDRRRPLPLPAAVRCYAIAATKGKRAGDLGDRLLGDGLVPVASALGRHKEAGLNLAIPESRQWVAYATNHLGLLDRPEVCARIRTWLAPGAD